MVNEEELKCFIFVTNTNYSPITDVLLCHFLSTMQRLQKIFTKTTRITPLLHTLKYRHFHCKPFPLFNATPKYSYSKPNDSASDGDWSINIKESNKEEIPFYSSSSGASSKVYVEPDKESPWRILMHVLVLGTCAIGMIFGLVVAVYARFFLDKKDVLQTPKPEIEDDDDE